MAMVSESYDNVRNAFVSSNAYYGYVSPPPAMRNNGFLVNVDDVDERNNVAMDVDEHDNNLQSMRNNSIANGQVNNCSTRSNRKRNSADDLVLSNGFKRFREGND